MLASANQPTGFDAVRSRLARRRSALLQSMAAFRTTRNSPPPGRSEVCVGPPICRTRPPRHPPATRTTAERTASAPPHGRRSVWRAASQSFHLSDDTEQEISREVAIMGVKNRRPNRWDSELRTRKVATINVDATPSDVKLRLMVCSGHPGFGSISRDAQALRSGARGLHALSRQSRRIGVTRTRSATRTPRRG